MTSYCSFITKSRNKKRKERKRNREIGKKIRKTQIREEK